MMQCYIDPQSTGTNMTQNLFLLNSNSPCFAKFVSHHLINNVETPYQRKGKGTHLTEKKIKLQMIAVQLSDNRAM